MFKLFFTSNFIIFHELSVVEASIECSLLQDLALNTLSTLLSEQGGIFLCSIQKGGNVRIYSKKNILKFQFVLLVNVR